MWRVNTVYFAGNWDTKEIPLYELLTIAVHVSAVHVQTCFLLKTRKKQSFPLSVKVLPLWCPSSIWLCWTCPAWHLSLWALWASAVLRTQRRPGWESWAWTSIARCPEQGLMGQKSMVTVGSLTPNSLLVTSGICSCPAAFWRPILNQQQQQSQRLVYLKAYKIVPLENSLMRRFPTVTSCRKDLLDSTMYVSGTQSNSTRRASSEKLLLPWKTKRGSVQSCCR